MKIKKCKQCGNSFEVKQPLQMVCSYKCALKFNTKKETAKRIKEMKKDLKTHSEYIKVLQSVFNKFIRLRDKDKGCVSCGKELNGTYHAGHFQPTSSHPELRFNEDNVHGQCVKCNMHLHGNLGNYANRLPKRIGWQRFESLFEPQDPQKLSIPEILELIKHYKDKLNEIQ